jgi:hypothetical protein
MKTVAIHQPEYFPWLGFLDKARRADVFVLLDHVQFDRSSLQHRAKVLGPNGAFWLTIPFVHEFPQTIDGLRFADDRYRTKHWKSLQQAYSRAPGWKLAAPKLEALFAKKHERVVDVTIASIELLFEAFGVKPTEIVRSSALGVVGEKAELVRDICSKLGATRYLSGRTGASYLDGADFGSTGIEVVVQSFSMPEYPRREVDAESARGLSALDAWLNLGERAASLLEEPGGPNR